MRTTLFTGHSLGGGLAACAASQNPNTTAITFDAMGTPRGRKTIRWIIPEDYKNGTLKPGKYIYALDGRDPLFKIYYAANYTGKHTSNIENYHNNLDFLTCLQEAFDIAAEAIGTSYNVGPFGEKEEQKHKEIQKHEDLVGALEALKHLPLKILLYSTFFLLIESIFNLESYEIIIHSLVVHDQTQNYLLPALQDWIKQQEDQKRPTKQ